MATAFTVDLLAARPMVGEAKSRQDLKKVLSGLREGKWSRKGLPRRDILAAVDDAFIHHRDHAARMLQGGDGYPSAKGIKGVKMHADLEECDIVIDGSREWSNHPHDYVSRIKFSNYRVIREAEGMTWMERARLLLEDNLQVDCDCDAFKYFYRHGATKRGFALVRERRAANIRNPAKRGSVCKHLEHALTYLGANYSTIASAMKQHSQHLENVTVSAKQNPISESLVSGTLHEMVTANGVLDVIEGLIASCAKKGMARTGSALRMASGMAKLEGSSYAAKAAPIDASIIPAPVN